MISAQDNVSQRHLTWKEPNGNLWKIKRAFPRSYEAILDGDGVEVEVQKSQITLHVAFLFLFNPPSIHPVRPVLSSCPVSKILGFVSGEEERPWTLPSKSSQCLGGASPVFPQEETELVSLLEKSKQESTQVFTRQESNDVNFSHHADFSKCGR